MPRLLFEKKGNAVWMSHLDLMRLFQRASKRAGLPLTHTQGFNPRPSVSIALPLSVGVESSCELLDFELDGQNVDCDAVRDGLNNALVEGIKVLDVYDGGRKVRDLALLQCTVDLEYDARVPDNAVEKLKALFASESLLVQKKTKSGLQDQDIIPMIRTITVSQEDEQLIQLNAVVCCQNPSLNPMQLSAAIATYLPECKPDFCKCSRIEIFDNTLNVFR